MSIFHNAIKPLRGEKNDVGDENIDIDAGDKMDDAYCNTFR